MNIFPWKSASLVGRLIAGTTATAALFGGLSCSSIGPGKLVSSHEGYNDAVQQTVTREVLKNIVRMRYADPMQFITVSSINAQFSVSAGGGLGPTSSSLTGVSVGYSDSPTITYVPQSDAGFTKSIDSPVELQAAMTYLLHGGKFQPHEIGLVIGAINDAPDRAGPAGDNYRARAQALGRLVERGAMLRHFRELYPRHAPIPVSQVDGRAYADAARAGFYFYDAGDGKLALASKHLGIGLVVPRPHEGQTAADLRTLGLSPGKHMYPIRGPAEAEPEPFGIQADTLWLIPRSVEGMMELAAMTVEVPPEHVEAGTAPVDAPAGNSGVHLSMQVRVSEKRPSSVYRIQHRGFWFYIDDTDTPSKILFSALVQAYSSQLGSRASGDDAPQIVLPIGGS
jgi:hypothetical protein